MTVTAPQGAPRVSVSLSSSGLSSMCASVQWLEATKLL